MHNSTLEVLSGHMHFIVVDLIGKFKLLFQGHCHALIITDILPNYAGCIPLYTIETDQIVHAYLINVYLNLCGLHKLLSDNGTDI